MDISLVANFDELRRCQNVLTDGIAEIEFRRFLQVSEENRAHWQSTIAEAQRLQRELDRLQRKYEECTQEKLDFETKLFHARRLLESESRAKRQLEEKLSTVCNFLHKDIEINDDVRDTLASLNMSSKKRSKSSKRGDERNCNEINSTTSFLSDLSVTQFDDDFLETTMPFKKHRPSTTLPNTSYVETKQRRRSARKSIDLRTKKNASVVEFDGSEEIIATATITIPNDDGPIEAISTIEAVPNSALYRKFKEFELDLPSSENMTDKEDIVMADKVSSTTSTSGTQRDCLNIQSEIEEPQKYPIPSAPPLQEIISKQKEILNIPVRQHEFSNRTIIRTESCSYCLKKLRFGTSSLKCRLCSVYLHQDCKQKFKMSCVPKSHDKHNKQGYLTDYVPTESPMIPPLIVHCVSEVEARGFSEKGIYRVSGSEKEIKSLKERILRGKSTLNLSNIDIHVVCGCIKDFLRGLKEPLIPTNLWKYFSNAVQNIDDSNIQRELYTAINQMPQPNRDTLAYLVLHLQRVANHIVAQMPVENLAKIFGPTVLGYSCSDPDHHAILSETMVQKDVMENLLKIPANYWAKFINAKSETSDNESQKSLGYSFFGTPSSRLTTNSLRKERKFFATPPYSTKRY